MFSLRYDLDILVYLITIVKQYKDLIVTMNFTLSAPSATKTKPCGNGLAMKNEERCLDNLSHEIINQTGSLGRIRPRNTPTAVPNRVNAIGIGRNPLG